MISVLVTLLLIILLFLTGKVFESIKRLLTLSVSVFLKILNLFGILINLREKRERVPKKFKLTFKDIRIVKKSKQNEKIIPSINLMALTILMLSVIVVVVNMTCDSIIAHYLYNNVGFINSLFESVDSVDTTITATMFSIMSFSVSKLMSQWKQTAKYRTAKKDIKRKEKVMLTISSKELLDIAKKKDADKLRLLVSNVSVTQDEESDMLEQYGDNIE